MREDFDAVIRLLRRATAAIPEDYISFPVAGQEAPMRRERVYCGELYHQMQLAWPRRLSKYRLSNEPDKDGHPFIGGRVKPDLIVHIPGSMDFNVAVIEVKPLPADTRGVRKDIATLRRFLYEGQYFGGILLFFGDVDASLQAACDLVRQTFARSRRAVVVLHHTSVGGPCAVRLRFGPRSR